MENLFTFVSLGYSLWSVFFLSPEDIEAQLTLSVTTVLAIVTFSILINQDLPKISYLSILDLWLVISFVFCVISSVESVISRIYFVKGKKDLAIKLTIIPDGQYLFHMPRLSYPCISFTANDFSVIGS